MQVVHVLEPFASGITTAVLNIIDELQDFEHIVIHGKRTSDTSIEKVRLKFKQSTKFILWKHAEREINIINDVKAFFELRQYLSQYKNAIIHLHSSKAGFLGRIACWSLGIKRVIYTPHGAAFIRSDVSELKRNVYKVLEKFAGCFGGYIVGCGKSEADLYASLGLYSTFVQNGADIDYEVDFSKKESQIVFAGIANRQKNPSLFNKIAEKVKKAYNVKFIWIGDGDLRNELISDNITITGWVPKKEVDSLLVKSTIYLSTSDWEGLPFGVLEAMNAGCALILHNVPGNKDLVTIDENGFLFDNADEAVSYISTLLKAPKKAITMGRASMRIAKEHFTKKKMGEGYRRIYTSI
ncbi:MAG: glycosyltransferase family 4 protein [Bacteroidales bacterium]|nr:glycosyltransferase family 4 protein [Bacteroidales bacterium]